MRYNKNYKMKFAGNYNLKDKTMKMKLDTGLSGALNLDKRFFSPGKDGFRYFSKEIDTSQYQGKSLLTALGLEFASYFTSFSSSMVKDNPVSNILGGLLGGNKKKNTTPKQGEKTKTPEKKDIKKDLEEKLKKKLFDKLF